MDILGQNIMFTCIVMNSVSARYYFYILRILEDMGVSRESLSDIIPTIKDIEAVSERISIDEFKELMNRAECELNDSKVGLHVSQKFRISGYAHAGEIYSACETIEQALAMTNKYGCLAHTIGRFEKVSVSEPHSMIKYAWQPSFNRNLADIYRHITECIISNYVETIKWLAWELGDSIRRVTFQHSARDSIADYKNIFGCDVVFDTSETSIFLQQDILEMPLRTSNPVKLSLLEKKLDQLLSEYNMTSNLIDRTKYILHKVIQSRRPTLKMVAQELSLSDRSLKRHLKYQGSNYQELLQEVKKELFAGYVKEGLSYAEIAQLLWYHDQSALTRAYKKWYGKSPTQHNL